MKPDEKKYKLIASFGYAIRGIGFMLKTQRNAQIHITAIVIAICLGLILKISPAEWLFIVFVIALVVAAELINTAIENLTDLISPGYHEKAGRVKDLSAGAVLICAIAAAITGFMIFLPKLIN
jgi:diacylglycerol kinase (ATP)